jgi:hypothetical protein
MPNSMTGFEMKYCGYGFHAHSVSRLLLISLCGKLEMPGIRRIVTTWPDRWSSSEPDILGG